MENPIKMDDLVVPLFLETPKCQINNQTTNPKYTATKDSPRLPCPNLRRQLSFGLSKTKWWLIPQETGAIPQ